MSKMLDNLALGLAFLNVVFEVAGFLVFPEPYMMASWEILVVAFFQNVGLIGVPFAIVALFMDSEQKWKPILAIVLLLIF